jgi:hypothetical protein
VIEPVPDPADVIALGQLVGAYARHADRRDAERFVELFEPDATLRLVRRGDEGRPLESRGRRQLAKVIGALGRFDVTYHLVANHTVRVTGDHATGEVYCVAHHLAADADGCVDHVMHLRYLDRYRRSDGVWRFAERETHVEWTLDQRVP